MGNVKQRQSAIEADRQNRNRSRRFLAALGVVVAAMTALALMLPAVSVTQENATQNQGFYRASEQSTEAAGAEQANDGAGSAAPTGNANDMPIAINDVPQSQETAADGIDAGENGPGSVDTVADPAAADPDAADAAADATGTAASNPQNKPATNTSKSAEGEVDGASKSKLPAQKFKALFRDQHDEEVLSVNVEAPEGALPRGTTMTVEEVSDEKILDAAKEKGVEKIRENAANADGEGEPGEAAETKALAVNITFRDADGEAVEPAKDVRVTLGARAVQQAVREAPSAESIALVHLDDKRLAEMAGVERLAEIDEQHSVEVEDAKSVASVVDDKKVDVDFQKEKVAFEAAEFSVYALVYTVDFHWEADGKTYEFALPGGGFVSLQKLVEMVGLANGAADGDAEAHSATETGEAPEAADSEADYAQADNTEASDAQVEWPSEALTLDDVVVSDATREFVANVESVVFSDPSLVWVAKVDAETTVGALKEANELEVQYSADLTEEQIETINAQVVEAGDWALISVLPFDTEETLTITMKNGDQHVIRVTDASYAATKVTDLNGKTVALVNLANNNALESTAHRGNGVGHLNAVGITYDASTNTVSTTDPYVVLSKWTFEKVPGTSDQYYINSANGYMNINRESLTVSPNRQALQVQQKADGTIRIKHPDNNYAVNNEENSTARGYNAYSSNWDANRGEWFTAFEIGAGAGMIALNPMNENGVLGATNHTSTSYKEMEIDGVTVDDAHLWNSRMFIPVYYDNNGEATITLPSHSQLGNFSVSTADPDTHSIVQSQDKYQWVLKGWVNIATGEYYDTSDGPVQATVKQDDLNVFYADWWAADYDYTLTDYIETADTSGFATIKMWDYNELFNLTSSNAWSVDHDAGQFIPRTTLESEEWYIIQVNGHQGDYFQFVDNTDALNCWQYGTLGNQQGRNDGNNWSNYNYSGSLGILGSQGQRPTTGVLESLFPSEIVQGSGVNYLGESNYLFSYDPASKLYSYDSSNNGAVYSQEQGRFFVAPKPKVHTTSVWYPDYPRLEPRTGFLPLNEYDQQLAFNNGSTNYWLGMSIDLDFWLPDKPGSSNDANLVTNTVTGQKQHMRFDFTGDDDVWVLIDGYLALDIGGIHEAVGGYIDFTTGEIRNAKGNTYNLNTLLGGSGLDAGAHTLSFYYLERGGNASNCKITFNIAPRWIEKPVQRGVASVTKEWSDDTPEEAKQSLSFHLEVGGVPVEGTYVGYEQGTVSGDVWSYMWSGLDPSLDYVVVEDEDPRFDQKYDDPEVDDVENVWGTASYDQEHAFGSDIILIGNALNDPRGRLLGGNGSSVAAQINNDIIEGTIDESTKWTVEGYSVSDQHFYLKNASGRYLSIKDGSIQLVNATANASWFYMSPSGDLNDAHSDYRLIVNGDGSIGVGSIVNSADETDVNSPDRVHVYTWFDHFAKTTNYSYENTFKTIDIPVTKEWSDSTTVDHSGDTISIALYQIALNSENEVVAEVEYPLTSPNTDQITGSKTITIRGLPVAGVYENEFVTYEYLVTEKTGKVGYIAHPHEDAENSGSWVITNIAPDDKDKPTSVSVSKHWRGKNEVDTASNHAGDELTFKLVQNAVDCGFVPVTMRWVNNRGGLYGEKTYYIRKQENFAFTVEKPETAQSHSVRISTDGGYTASWESNDAGSHEFVVSNVEEAITVTATLGFLDDVWGDSPGASPLTWGHSVTLSNDLVDDVDDVVEASKDLSAEDTQEYLYEFTKDTISDGPFDESASDWTATIDDLPLYKKIEDGVYYTYYYTISELSVNGKQVHPTGTTTEGSTEDFIVSIDQGSMTITNTEKEKVSVTASKAWSNADGTTSPPADASVTFELYADGQATGKTVILNGKADVAENPGASEELISDSGNSANAYESPAWTAVWNDLQKYTYQDGGITVDGEIDYTVREVTGSIPSGYAADYGSDGGQPKEEAASGGTVTNRELVVAIDIVKADKDDGSKKLAGAVFTLYELNDVAPTPNGTLSYVMNGSVIVSRDSAPTAETTGKTSFDGLTEGFYEIRETKSPAGYVLATDAVFYVKVHNGVVTFLIKGAGKPSTWAEAYNAGLLSYASAQAAVEADPGNGIEAQDAVNATATVGNTPGEELPHTGGPGTVLFSFLGIALACLACAWLVARRRGIRPSSVRI